MDWGEREGYMVSRKVDVGGGGVGREVAGNVQDLQAYLMYFTE